MPAVLDRIGKYEVLRRLAAGGMATVYLGRVVGEAGFERRVAIKVMHAHIAEDPDFVAMFLDEARLAALIHHPNVVPTLDVSRSSEGLFLVMDYIEGGTLGNLLRALKKRKEHLSLGIALRIVVDTLTGLNAAHELEGPDGTALNLIHRDVSPHNVLIGFDGIARITDFGVARAEARISATRGGQLKGKLPYMAPEQIRSEPIDRRVDVYSVGVMLWEILAGQRPFQAENDPALVLRILVDPLPSLRELNPTVPPAVEALCLRALSRNRDERFPTALAFADEIEDCAQRLALPLASSRAVAALAKSELRSAEPASSRPSREETVTTPLGFTPSGQIDPLAAVAEGGPPASSGRWRAPVDSAPDASGRHAASDGPQSALTAGPLTVSTAAATYRTRATIGLATTAAAIGALLTVVWLAGRASSPAAVPAPVESAAAAIVTTVPGSASPAATTAAAIAATVPSGATTTEPRSAARTPRRAASAPSVAPPPAAPAGSASPQKPARPKGGDTFRPSRL